MRSEVLDLSFLLMGNWSESNCTGFIFCSVYVNHPLKNEILLDVHSY